MAVPWNCMPGAGRWLLENKCLLRARGQVAQARPLGRAVLRSAKAEAEHA